MDLMGIDTFSICRKKIYRFNQICKGIWLLSNKAPKATKIVFGVFTLK